MGKWSSRRVSPMVALFAIGASAGLVIVVALWYCAHAIWKRMYNSTVGRVVYGWEQAKAGFRSIQGASTWFSRKKGEWNADWRTWMGKGKETKDKAVVVRTEPWNCRDDPKIKNEEVDTKVQEWDTRKARERYANIRRRSMEKALGFEKGKGRKRKSEVGVRGRSTEAASGRWAGWR